MFPLTESEYVQWGNLCTWTSYLETDAAAAEGSESKEVKGLSFLLEVSPWPLRRENGILTGKNLNAGTNTTPDQEEK